MSDEYDDEMVPQPRALNRYAALIEEIFFAHYSPGDVEFVFDRVEVEEMADVLGIKLPKNVGDVIYSFRYRRALPDRILATAPEGMEWVIDGAGRSKYAFRLVRINRIVPRADLVTIKIPDSTPEIISYYALNDEQALLAIVRYNRLIDIFLGLTTYSLQNHLRTTVLGIGQIEIDEIYVGLDRNGCQYVIPVQAKGGSDQLGVVQTKQDIACCGEKFPDLVCRTVSAQFMSDNRIALFELTVQDDQVLVVDEKHYKLVPSRDISPDDLRDYSMRSYGR